MVAYKNGTLCEKMPKVHMPRAELSDFLKGILKFVVLIQTHGHGILKSSFSSLCLIVGVGFISRVLMVLEKTNNKSFEMPFL